MMTFHVNRPDAGIRPRLVAKIDDLTKPKGSLGRLEEIALQVGLVQQTLTPRLCRPQNVLFAADHGIEREGVSLSPRAVTWQQVLHFLRGGAGINFLCRQHGFRLKVVDAGVDYTFPPLPDLIDLKVRRGTRNFLHEPALTPAEVDLCLRRGAEVVDRCHGEGSNLLSFGEMGIGNTSTSSMWMTCLTGIPLEQCVGAGSGLDRSGVSHKLGVLRRALARYDGLSGSLPAPDSPMPDPSTTSASKATAPTESLPTESLPTESLPTESLPTESLPTESLPHPTAAPAPPACGSRDVMDVITYFGGLEMDMAVGGMLRAAELGMVVLVDGFIMTACLLAASRLCPAVVDYAIFGHCGDEAGHRLLLDYLGARPLLSLGLRLGEGSGAVCAYPLVESAVRMLGEMDTFSRADVTKYF